MQNYLSEIQLYAGHMVPVGFMPCDGRTLPIAQYSQLFSMIGTTYGGDGRTTFDLPNIAAEDNIKYYICTQSSAIGPMSSMGFNVVGEMGSVGARFTPRNWHVCDGTSLAVASYPELYSVIGNTYGGDSTNFNLPTIADIPPVPGSTGDTSVLIRVLEDPTAPVNLMPILSSIMQWAGATQPDERYWHACDGALLSISQYPALFALIGTIFGGDGRTDFALPKMDTGNQTKYYIAIQGNFPKTN